MRWIFLLPVLLFISACFRNAKNLNSNSDFNNKMVEDSLLERNIVIQAEQLAKLQKELADSIRIADSIAAIPTPINYDTVLFASISRSPCFGKCPHYEIILYQSGLVEYQGYAFVDKIGKFQCRIDSNNLIAITEMADKCNFFELNDFYPQNGMPISDFPMCVCSLKKNEELKIVYNRNNAPLNLMKFQNFLDRIFEDRQWEAVGTTHETKALFPDRP